MKKYILKYYDLVKLTAIKRLGNTTWYNFRLEEMKIPLKTKLKFETVYGLIFLDKWNFMIDATMLSTIPNNTIAIIDILHNNQQTTATCEFLGGTIGKVTNISCVSDYNLQNEKDNTDTIKINHNKNYGTVEWSPAITEDKLISDAAVPPPITVTFIDAYDMHYSGYRWTFTVQAKVDNFLHPGNIYRIKAYYKDTSSSYNGTNYIIAHCLLSVGMRKNKNILLKCSFKDYWSYDYLVLIRLGNTGDNYKQITLKTSLTLVRAYNLIYNKTLSFYIEVREEAKINGILPAGSKVIVDVDNNKYSTVTCNAINTTCLFCNTSITSNNYIALKEIRSLESSVEWVKNEEDDYLIYKVTALTFFSAFNLTFNTTDNKWHFIVNIGGGTVNTKYVIDVLYDDEPSTARCVHYESRYMRCSVNKADQSITSLIKISKTKTDFSTITWYTQETAKPLAKDQPITLLTELNFVKAINLRANPDNNKAWLFDIHVSNENIP